MAKSPYFWLQHPKYLWHLLYIWYNTLSSLHLATYKILSFHYISNMYFDTKKAEITLLLVIASQVFGALT